MPSSHPRSKARNPKFPGRPALSSPQLLAILRRFIRAHPRAHLSLDAFNAWPERDCCAATIAHRFGGWPRALRKAGATPLRRYYSPNELVRHYERLWRRHGRPPGTHLLNRSRGPSQSPYLVRWGTLPTLANLITQYRSGQISRDQLLHPSRPPRQPALRAQEKLAIFQRDNYTCQCCGASPVTHPGTQLTIDHITPLCRGGTNARPNLRTLCRSCNSRKGSGPDPTSPTPVGQVPERSNGGGGTSTPPPTAPLAQASEVSSPRSVPRAQASEMSPPV